ncbi:MAG: GntR family transcriptional regulator [Anaerolineaceae bacterium]|nr:GntR family transcriptional regulator [Anaerolineaceae bacterium]
MEISSDAFPMINHKQLRSSVAERLRSDILDGRLKPGEWLRQERLAQVYGVSQMPVREALKALEAEGLVEHVPYRGARVVAFSADDVEDLYATRSFLEGRAAYEAASRITDEQNNQLRALHEKMIKCTSTAADVAYYRLLNRQFHLLIVNASQRAYLERMLNQMWDTFPTMMWSNFALTAETSLPSRVDSDNKEHELLIRALEKHDPQEAKRVARLHVESSGGLLASALRNEK